MGMGMDRRNERIRMQSKRQDEIVFPVHTKKSVLREDGY